MYTVYNIKDLDKLAKRAVDKIFSTVGSLHYKSEHWEVVTYDFTINVPVDLPSDEFYPQLSIRAELKHVTKRSPNQTITFAEYL